MKDVREGLAGERPPLAYTTVMTVLDRLARRGAVERRKHGRRFLYKPRMDREHARRLAVRELVDTYFGGSVASLRAHLAQESPSVVGTDADPSEILDPTLL